MQPFFQAMNFHLDSMRALGTLAVVLGLSGCAGWTFKHLYLGYLSNELKDNKIGSQDFLV